MKNQPDEIAVKKRNHASKDEGAIDDDEGDGVEETDGKAHIHNITAKTPRSEMNGAIWEQTGGDPRGTDPEAQQPSVS